jgi:WD40 repeat protein
VSVASDVDETDPRQAAGDSPDRPSLRPRAGAGFERSDSISKNSREGPPWLDSQTGHTRREIEIPQSNVQRLALSPDGQSVAVGFFSTLYPPGRGFIRIFRMRDKQAIQTIELPCAWIDALCFTPDGKQIVAGLQDTSIVFWDVRLPQ